MPAHAKYAPSAADRWVACLRAVPLEAKAPPDISGEAAQLGTDAHEVAALFMKGEVAKAKQKSDILGEQSPEHVTCVVDYIQHINDVVAEMIEADGAVPTVMIEEKVAIYEPYSWGTADTIIIGKSVLFVSDLKTGSGYTVPIETWQLRAYAVGVVKHCRDAGIAIPKTIRLEIFQPRSRDVSPVRQVDYDLSDLVEFEIDIRDAIDRSLAGEGGFEVGGHCRWCRAKADCPGMAAAAVDLAHLRMHNGDPEAALDPQALGPQQLDEALKLALVVEPWIKALWARATRYLELGGSLEQAKLVEKKRQRKWLEEDDGALASMLLDKFNIDPHQPAKVKSPAQFEKDLTQAQKTALEKLYSNKSTGLTITTADDKRPAAMNPEALKAAGDLLDAQMGKKSG